MTPGSQPTKVKRRLIKNSEPNPWFRNTANGGNKIFNIMVNIIIILSNPLRCFYTRGLCIYLQSARIKWRVISI